MNVKTLAKEIASEYSRFVVPDIVIYHSLESCFPWIICEFKWGSKVVTVTRPYSSFLRYNFYNTKLNHPGVASTSLLLFVREKCEFVAMASNKPSLRKYEHERLQDEEWCCVSTWVGNFLKPSKQDLILNIFVAYGAVKFGTLSSLC